MGAERRVDPGILELVGELADLLGLAERIQRFLPTQRLKVQRKHKRIEKLLDAFSDALSDARTALRIVSTTADRHLADTELEAGASRVAAETPDGLARIGFSMPADEMPVYRRGVEQVQLAIQRMTRAAFDLEATATGVGDEVQRYYKISQAGSSVLRGIRHALDDHPEAVPDLLREVEKYLARCSQMLEERQHWLDQ